MNCLCVMAEKKDSRRVTHVQSVAQDCLLLLRTFKIEVEEAVPLLPFVETMQVEVESELESFDLKILDGHMHRAHVLLVECIDIDTSSDQHHCNLATVPLKVAHQHMQRIVAVIVTSRDFKLQSLMTAH